MSDSVRLAPRLVVPDADAALDFYARALGAEPGMRLRAPNGVVVHAEMVVFGLRMSLTEDGSGGAGTPASLGGSPVLLMLDGVDPDAVQAAFVAAGGEVIFPVADRPYGARDGRLRDVAGHVWLVSKTLETLDEAALQARLGG
jgi:PhnB protein